MDTRRRFLLSGGSALAALAAFSGWRTLASAQSQGAATPAPGAAAAPAEHFEVTHTDAEWRKLLTADGYEVLRHEGTERPFTSPLNDEHRTGHFACAGCALDLFASRTKFDSGTGWPSFYAPLDHAVSTRADLSFGMVRTEVHCRRCGGHLGHLFDDGPKPTGLRYCMNGVAMTFKPDAA
ncbi:MAG TPA: peptide-methionine (R)-S-oxide reductase MsrB [Pararobbsia sp.]|jgi:peptide-methionine (R)-S-oxide reductase|nr:peptide-methionine (R)-S-oxide reductase MsrB [Pararobbsia sp.]